MNLTIENLILDPSILLRSMEKILSYRLYSTACAFCEQIKLIRNLSQYTHIKGTEICGVSC